jgi:2-polyprenyl-6-hydroxyphenyl methylase/3-demethylubiquinone-9 3-methyltransferase
MRNSDPTEVQKFSNLAATWWDKDGESKPLHDINPLRFQFINDHVDLAGKRVLDIGCGGGILTESLASIASEVAGVDASEKTLNVARLHQASNDIKNIQYEHTTAEIFAEKNKERIDVITCMELLEHVPDPASLIQACNTLLKPGGHIFFSTLNRTPKAYLFAIIGAEYILKMLPKKTHDYAKFIKPSELERWARGSNLQLKHMRGMGYNPLSKIYKLTTDTSVNYLAHYEKD